jgi:hypothetical protein
MSMNELLLYWMEVAVICAAIICLNVKYLFSRMSFPSPKPKPKPSQVLRGDGTEGRDFAECLEE